jgi:hypothetical protein
MMPCGGFLVRNEDIKHYDLFKYLDPLYCILWSDTFTNGYERLNNVAKK